MSDNKDDLEFYKTIVGRLHKPRPLPEVFQKYAGIQIPHEDYEYESRAGRKYNSQRPTEEGAELLREIYQVAADNNVQLRLWTPNVMGTMDVQTSRLNMRTTGDWVIKDICDYG